MRYINEAQIKLDLIFKRENKKVKNQKSINEQKKNWNGS